MKITKKMDQQATKPMKSGDWLSGYVDMSRIQLDVLKPDITKEITNILQIEDFVCNQLKVEQFVCPTMMLINMIEYINVPLLKKFIGELWTLLLAAESNSTGVPTDSIQQKKDEILVKETHIEHYKRNESLKSCSHSQSRKQGDNNSHILKPPKLINMAKVKLDALRPWICKTITNILCREDEKAIEFVYKTLKKEKLLCPMKLQINIAGFLSGAKGQRFISELWPLLLSAEESIDSVPSNFVQQKRDENMISERNIKHSERYDGTTSCSRSSKQSDRPNSPSGSNAKEQKPKLFPSTLNTKKQQPSKDSTKNSSNHTEIQNSNKESNKKSKNIEKQTSKRDKSKSRDQNVDKDKSTHRRSDHSRSRNKERSHSSRSSSSNKPNSKAIETHRTTKSVKLSPDRLYERSTGNSEHQQYSVSHFSTTRERGSYDGTGLISCVSDTLENICLLSPGWYQETNIYPQNQCPPTPLREFLSENCAAAKDIFSLWNESTEKLYNSDGNNIKTGIQTSHNAILLLPSAAAKVDHKQLTSKIDLKEAVKSKAELRASSDLPSSKRSQSPMHEMIENNSSVKDEQQQPPKKKHKNSKNSSLKSSSKEVSYRNSKPESSKKKNQLNSRQENGQFVFNLFGSKMENI